MMTVQGDRVALPSYPAYKPVGLAGLAEIPVHWETKRAKFLFREVNEPSEVGEEELLSVSHITGVTPRSEKNITMFMAESYEGFKTCQPGDLVINTMWAWMGALGVSPLAGIVSSSYGVYRLRNGAQFNPRYLDLLLRTKVYVAEYTQRSTGINSSRLRLYPEDFFDVAIIQPPTEDQDAIVAFLDHKLADIDRFIRNKERLVALLKEQKTTIINRAVTRGLDPSVNMKPSSVEWLREIPEHWETKPVKLAFDFFNHKRIPLSGTERERMKLRRYDYYGASGIIDKVDDYIFDDTLILIAEDGANLRLRNLPLAFIASGKFWVNNHAHILKPKEGNIHYFVNLMESIDYDDYITGAAQPKMTQARLSSVVIPIPPLDEQNLIADFVNAESRRIELAISMAEREIELMREYRAALIAEAVMGKIDCRGDSAVIA